MRTCETCNYSVEGDRAESTRCEHVAVPAIYKLHLRALIGTYELATRWWITPNKAFDGNTPKSYHEAGGDKEMEVAQYVLGMLQR